MLRLYPLISQVLKVFNDEDLSSNRLRVYPLTSLVLKVFNAEAVWSNQPCIKGVMLMLIL